MTTMRLVSWWHRGALAGMTALLAFTLGWTGVGSSANAARPLRVVATTTQVTDFARIVAGNAAQVVGILPANVDPHDYEAVPGDLEKIASADLVVENGAGMEDAWMTGLLQSVHRRVRVVDTSRGISLLPGSAESPRGDPHIWFAVPNAAQMVANIRDAMAQADPANAAYYRANAARYVPQLDALDKYIFATIATLPRAQRKLVTSHDAFNYYVTRYGLTLVGARHPKHQYRGRSLGPAPRRARRRDPARARQGDLPRDVGQSQGRAADRPGSRRAGRHELVRGHPWARGV